MQDHFQINTEEFFILSQKLSLTEIFKSIPLFDPYKSGEQINHVGLMYFLDEQGDFNEGKKTVGKRIAKAVFASLDNKEKVDIISYLDFLEEESGGEARTVRLKVKKEKKPIKKIRKLKRRK